MLNERSGQSSETSGAVAILDAALRAFERVGYEGASMRVVAKDAGLSVSSIYHHYENKQELFFGIVKRVSEDLVTMTEVAFERGVGEDPRQRVRILITDFIGFYVERSLECKILDKERRHLAEDNSRWQIDRRRVVQSRVDDIIASGVESGEFRPLFPELVGRSVMVMCRDVCNWYHDGGAIDRTKLIDGYVAQAFALLGCSESEDPHSGGPGGPPRQIR